VNFGEHGDGSYVPLFQKKDNGADFGDGELDRSQKNVYMLNPFLLAPFSVLKRLYGRG